jgi:hypothetical protein
MHLFVPSLILKLRGAQTNVEKYFMQLYNASEASGWYKPAQYFTYKSAAFR